MNSDRYLAIWIGPCEADAITVELQGVPVQRPLTHDLLKSVIDEMGAKVEYIIVNDLHDDIFYANIIVKVNGKQITIDSRPSDAIALAVRVRVPVYVEDDVMDRAAVTPDEDMETEAEDGEEGEEGLSIFEDFVDTLDLDDLEDNE
jgi:bifunctional DNase/RNase